MQIFLRSWANLARSPFCCLVIQSPCSDRSDNHFWAV
jgi:hypothetical protein